MSKSKSAPANDNSQTNNQRVISGINLEGSNGNNITIDNTAPEVYTTAINFASAAANSAAAQVQAAQAAGSATASAALAANADTYRSAISANADTYRAALGFGGDVLSANSELATQSVNAANYTVQQLIASQDSTLAAYERLYAGAITQGQSTQEGELLSTLLKIALIGGAVYVISRKIS